MQPVIFANDPQFWHETQRTLGHAAYGGADTGEVFATVQRIVPGDYDSWHDQWLTTAERISAESEAALISGHLVSSRDGFLRASNYYRSAEFFLHDRDDDARIIRVYDRQVESFRWASALFDSPIEPVAIPYDGVSLGGYFYTAPGHGPRPTIVMHNGFDGSAEEMHFFGAAAALERGYNVLSYDGPGQPAARRRHGLVFRPDWEHVIWQVLDWTLRQPEVDPARIALLGVSMGGYLAVRAAAFERRLAACIAIDGLYDLGKASVAHMPVPSEVAEELPSYTLADGIAEQVRCPTAICEAEEDYFFDGQAREIYEHLTCRKRLFHFSAREGAGAHCHSGAQRLAFGRVYDWLDETLGCAQPLNVGGLLLDHPSLST